MAIYRLSAQVIGRSSGKSVVAAAAYRAGVSLDDARAGMVWDYTRRQTVEHVRILAPVGAPSWVMDRGMLWNAVEATEKRKDSQLARELQLSLPGELSLDDQVRLLEGWVDRECVGRGMVADLAVHSDEGNPHAHVLLTMRGLEGEAFGKKATDWNRVELLEGWRASWAEAINQALAARGAWTRVDHRSLAAQGIDREPKNLGRAAYEMERRGERSRQGEAMRERQRERDRKRKERTHGTRTRSSSEPEALDLTWALGLDPSAVALDGGRGRGRTGEALAGLGELGGPDLAAPAPGPGALGGPDAPGAGADPGAGVVGRGVGGGPDLPAPAGVEAPGTPVLAASAPDGAAGGSGLAAAGQQPRGPVREALDLERIYERAEAVHSFARELGAGLKRELWNREDLDEAAVEALRTAESPIFIPPREGFEVLLDPEGREVHQFVSQSPRTMGSEVEALAYVTQEPEAEPVLAEELLRTAYGLDEQPEAYYARPWAERQADLVQDSLQVVAAQTDALQEAAEQTACEKVPRLWDKLRDTMAAVSRWGHDLVATWSLTREIRKAEKDLAVHLGRPVRPQSLPRDPRELQEILQNRQEALQEAWEARRRTQAAPKPQDASRTPPGGSKGRSGGMPR